MALTRAVTVLALFVVLAALALFSLTVGAVHVALADLMRAPHGSRDAAAYVLQDLRAPRIVAGILVGASLGMGGAILQTALRNPLADPYLMGASGGAGLSVAIATVASAPPGLYGTIAFGGALAASSVSLGVARGAGPLSQQRLILAGIGISSFCTALTTLVILLAPQTGTALSILSWLGGSLAGHGWSDVRWATLEGALGLAIAVFILPSLDAMRLGRERAAGVGVDVARTHLLVVVAASLLAGAAVTVSGVIGFVGLLVPHAARVLVGGSVPWLTLACAPLGALVVLIADLIARGAAPPLELPVGVLLSVVGVPAFLALVVRRAQFA